MPYKEKDIEKLYYTIGEVSEMLNLNASQIRFWHKHFDIIKPHKNKHGTRLFTAKDIDAITKVNELVNEKGFTIQGAKQYLEQSPEMFDDKREQAIAYLRLLKEKLLILKDQNNSMP
ncbi:MAG: MerR family transcriptional regulator [Bacteroidia bacterium]|nr:MerR family transcriptional regulator [Bacteroidia bacterium]MCZ2247313.1 MerR family transcriptional regulator [Bacteroidia bacterium]